MKLLVVLVFAVAAVAGDDAPPPDTVDWRVQGAVTPIRNMGQYDRASCAFAVAGAVESLNFIKTGTLVSLSPQNLADCAYDASIPASTWVLAALQYAIDNGIDTEASYPYEALEDDCRYDPSNVGATATSFTNLTLGDEDALKQAVAAGPVVTSIDASHESFQFYNSGIYDEPDCSNTALDHVVLIIGYGTLPEGGDYWLVKNSWGEQWGLGGYIMMSRNKNNQCGIATAAYQVM